MCVLSAVLVRQSLQTVWSLLRVCILVLYSAKNNNFELILPVVWAASYSDPSHLVAAVGSFRQRERCWCRPKPAVIDAVV